jgi:membrane associated rhomboid family serine protease
VPAGLILGLFTLLCGLASGSLLVIPNKKAPVLAVIVGLILLLGCYWVLEKCFRLVSGRRKRGGLMSPNALRVVSFFLLILPIVGIFTGYYRDMGPVAIFQAVMYFSGFLGLRALARKRQAEGESDDRAKE